MDIDDKKDVHEESHARRHKLVRDEPRKVCAASAAEARADCERQSGIVSSDRE